MKPDMKSDCDTSSKELSILGYDMLRYLMMLIFLLGPGMLNQAMAQKRILVVHSYHEGYEWTDDIQSGINHAMTDKPFGVQVYYMDTKRHTDEAWKIQAGRKAMQLVDTFKPDVVIATDDNAQAYFAQALSKQDDGPRIVFCGVNAAPQDYGYPNAKATGFLGRSHLTATLKLAHAIKPGIKRITLLSDDSLTSTNAYDYYRTLNMPLEIVAYQHVANFTQWQTAVIKANLNSDAILITMYHTLKKASSDTMSMQPSEVMNWTINNSRIPILGVYPFTIKDGAVLGICSSGREHGYLAAITAMDMIRTGYPASRYPINTSVEGTIMFNLQSAGQYHIQIPEHLQKMAKIIIKQNEQSTPGNTVSDGLAQ